MNRVEISDIRRSWNLNFSYPLPDFALTPPECQRHTSLQIASLADVQYLQIDGVVGFDVTICMQFNLDSSNPAQWKLSFRDYTEREKMIRLFSHQFEAVNSKKLPINVCPSFSPWNKLLRHVWLKIDCFSVFLCQIKCYTIPFEKVLVIKI